MTMRIAKAIFRFVCIWVGLALLVLLYTGFTSIPRTIVGWALFLFFAPVAYIAMEGAFWLVSAGLRNFPPARRFAEWVGQRTAGEELSLERIFWGVFGVVLFFSVFVAGLWSVGRLIDWIKT